MKWNTFLELVSNKGLFELIVRSELSGIDNGVTHDIWSPASPKSKRSSFCIDLSVAVNRARVFGCATLGNLNSLSLQSNFDHIHGVGESDSNSTRGHPCCDLLDKRGVLARRKRT